MRRAVHVVAAACLLAGPAVLAFHSGGYFTQPRLIAAIVAWALVFALAVVGSAPLPRTRPGWLVLAGLVGMTGWSALSIVWASQAGPATENVQRLVLYVGALLLAVGVLRDARVQRVVEPALAAGATLVIGYGLSGRLLPDVVHLDRSRSADGRLEQPLTYWNAEGALAAVGLVLCARLAGDRTRPPAIRALAAAAAAPLGAGLYLSYSRGAVAAAGVGLLVLLAAAPTRDQLRAVVITLTAGIAGAACSAAFPGVASLEGAHRGRDGAIVLALLAIIGVAAVLGARAGAGADERLAGAGRIKPIAVVAVAGVVAGLLVGALGERPSQAELAAGAEPGRLATASSNRYEYWRVALDAFLREPLTGLGSGGFRVEWLKERTIAEAVKDTHSLELEAAAELGLPGLLALLLMVGGAVLAAGRALVRDAAAAAGASAAALTWLLHASIDWDWQLPAVTLPAIVLTGALIVFAESC
jgi:hypothetical protein